MGRHESSKGLVAAAPTLSAARADATGGAAWRGRHLQHDDLDAERELDLVAHPLAHSWIVRDLDRRHPLRSREHLLAIPSAADRDGQEMERAVRNGRFLCVCDRYTWAIRWNLERWCVCVRVRVRV